jgi:hypothetical protein
MGVTIIPSGMEHAPEYFVPDYNKDIQLEPNFFCRARNVKREKYCRARAGQGTDHLGQGRCMNHGGKTPIKHGRYSLTIGGSVGEHLDRLELETEKEKMDVMPEATLLRGITLDVGERFHEWMNAIIAWNHAEAEEAAVEERRPKFLNVPELKDLAIMAKQTAEIVNMIHKQRSANAITMPDFMRLMAAMADVVVSEIDKLERYTPLEKLDEAKSRINEAWRKIKLQA